MKNNLLLVSLLIMIFSNSVLAGDCQSSFSNIYDMYDRPASVNNTSYSVQAIRLYHDGNTSFAMNENYNPSAGYFNNAGSGVGFTMIKHESADWGGEAYTVGGRFKDMFPSRNAAALTTLSLYRTGQAKITLNDDGNKEFYLEDLNCSGIDKNKFLVTGVVRVNEYISSWLFAIKRN